MNAGPQHVIFGAGAIGLATLDALRRRGETARLVNRSGTAPVPDDIEVLGGDASDPAFTAAAAHGAQVVYQTLNPPYHQWVELFPPSRPASWPPPRPAGPAGLRRALWRISRLVPRAGPPPIKESTNMDAPNATPSAPVTAVMAGHGHRPVTGRETTMQAIVQERYGSADVLELADIDQPVPVGNEVLMQVQAAGLHRGDWHVMTGLPYLIRIVVPALGLRKPKSPVLGMDVVGRVEAVGSKVTRFQPGDEVFGWCDGSFAEYASAPEDQLAAKPANLSFEQAAAVPISGFAALQALRDVGQIQAGQKVLVIGAAGAVGSFGVQLAKAFGAQVTGVASTTQADLVRSAGADEVIDYTRADVTDGSRHWDLIIDTAGRRPLSQLRRALTPKGTLVIVGGEGGGRWMGGFLRNLRAPVLSRFVGQRLRMLASKENQEDLQTLAELLEAGKLTPRIGRTYPLGEVPDAIRALEAGNTRGKIVITV